ncbi:hypothetical protein LEMLEM_LOCUS13163, partial [Lemmus lemmus]
MMQCWCMTGKSFTDRAPPRSTGSLHPFLSDTDSYGRLPVLSADPHERSSPRSNFQHFKVANC